jgi:hypothetical protein
MDMHPCDTCGDVNVRWDSALTDLDGQLVRRYYGTCPGCDAERDFHFALPDEPVLPGPDDVVCFGGPQPSQLLDAGEWLLIADVCGQAGSAPAPGDAGRTEARESLAIAVAAVEEVLKFIPTGADAVPEAGFWSARGGRVRAAGRGRFDRSRLMIVRDAYRDALAQL